MLRRQAVVRLLVEAELRDGRGLLRARVIVVARGVLEAELEIVVRPDELRRVDGAAFERRIDLAGRQQDDGRAGLRVDLAGETGDAGLEALEVIDGVDLLPEPAAHLRIRRLSGPRDDAEGCVGFFP